MNTILVAGDKEEGSVDKNGNVEVKFTPANDGLETRGLTENSEAEAIVEQVKEKIKSANTPANEWREDVKEMFSEFPTLGGITPEMLSQNVIDVIQKTLDQHSAHLVAKIEKERRKVVGTPLSRSHRAEYNQALDQAIDIIKDNK